MRLNLILGAAILAAGFATSPLPAAAADLGALYAPSGGGAAPQQPLEFGTGWYLRGDAGASFEDHPKLDTALGTFDTKATSAGYSLGIGAGYQFNSWLRADLTADYLDPFRYRDTTACGPACSLSLTTNISRWDGLANGYIDLGNWSGITPYVGAGAGVSGTHQKGTVDAVGGAVPFAVAGAPADTVSTIRVPSHNSYQFAWAAMAGLSYGFTPHMLLDVGYRYLDLGKTTIPLYPITSVQKNLTMQQVRVGIRYLID